MTQLFLDYKYLILSSSECIYNKQKKHQIYESKTNRKERTIYKSNIIIRDFSSPESTVSQLTKQNQQ